MGGTKDQMIKHEEDLAAATGYLVHTGNLKRCEHHDEVYGGGGWDLGEDFYRYAMADRNRGDRGLVPWAAPMKTREFTDLLKEAYEDHPADSCGRCDKIMAE